MFQTIFSSAAAEIERKPQYAAAWLGEEGAVLAQDFHGLRKLTALNGEKPPALSPEAERSRLLAAASAFFQRAARSAPLVLLLEDAQWADALSLALAAHLVENLAADADDAAPIFILANHHAEPGAVASPFSRWLDRLSAPRLRRLNLSPLNEDEIGQLLAASLGMNSPPPALVIRHFHAMGGGNPYLTLEALRADIAAGRLKRIEESGGWDFDGWRQSRAAQETPAPLADAAAAAVRRRIDALPEQDLDALRAAALLGRQFPFRWWPTVAGLSEGTLVDAADRAIRAGLLEELPGEQLRFTRDLMRAALAADLSGLKRRRLHGKIVETIENEGLVDENLELLAQHAIEARLTDQAVYYGLRAAEKLFEQFMLEAAADLLQRLRLAAPDPGILPAAVQMQWLALEIYMNLWLGNYGRILSQAESLLRIAGQAGDRKRQRIALRALAGFQYSQGNYPLTKELALQAYDLDCERESPAFSRELQSLLINAAIRLRDFADAARRLESERAWAATHNDRVVMMTLLHHSGFLCEAQGDDEGLRAYMEDSLAISTTLPEHEEMGFTTASRTRLIEHALKHGDLDRAAAMFPEAEAGARGRKNFLIKLNALRGELLIRQGQVAEGTSIMKKAALEAGAAGAEVLKNEIEAASQAMTSL